MENSSIYLCRVIMSCKNLRQLEQAEKLMIQSGKDFTNVVEAKRQQLTKPKKCDTAREIHNAINRRLTEIGRR